MMIISFLAYSFIFSYVKGGLFGLDPTRTGYTEYRPTDGFDSDNSIELIKNLQTLRQFEEMAKILFGGMDSLLLCRSLWSKSKIHGPSSGP